MIRQLIREMLLAEVGQAIRENVADNDDEVIRDFATLLAPAWEDIFLNENVAAMAIMRYNLDVLKGSVKQDTSVARGATLMIKLLDAVDAARGKINKGDRDLAITSFYAIFYRELKAAGLEDIYESWEKASIKNRSHWRGWEYVPHISKAVGRARGLVELSRWGPLRSVTTSPGLLSYAHEFEKAMRGLAAHPEELTKCMQLREATPKFVRFFKDPSTEDYREKIIELLCGDLDSVLQAAELAEALMM